MDLDEREQVKPLLWNPTVDRTLAAITNDRNLLSLFLTGVSYLEGIGELAIAAIRQSEISRFMHDLRRHELEEHGHMTSIRLVIQELFPDLCVDGRHVYESDMFDVAGRQFYHKVRDTTRRRLRQLGRYSPLNLYLLITFGGETLVEMLYARVIEALGRSTLPRPITERIEFIFRMILAQEDTHDVLLTEQHNKVLAADRTGLSDAAVSLIDQLGRLTAEDYRWVSEFMIREFVWWMSVVAREPAADVAPASGSAG
jgi:hypothetical protein